MAMHIWFEVFPPIGIVEKKKHNNKKLLHGGQLLSSVFDLSGQRTPRKHYEGQCVACWHWQSGFRQTPSTPKLWLINTSEKWDSDTLSPDRSGKQMASAPRQHFSESDYCHMTRKPNEESSVGWGAVPRPLKMSQLSDQQEYMWKKSRTLWLRLARKT